jgi:hypothetical protein
MPFGSKLAYMFDVFLAGGSPAKVSVNSSTRQRIHDLYCEGNSRLAEKYHLPLAQFGYPMLGAGN